VRRRCRKHSYAPVFSKVYGAYVRTAGQRLDPRTSSKCVLEKSMGRFAPVFPGNGMNYNIRSQRFNDNRKVFEDCPMKYKNWSRNNMDFAQHSDGSPESCINIWPKYGYGWNDEPCQWQHCFVCEYRPEGDRCPV